MKPTNKSGGTPLRKPSRPGAALRAGIVGAGLMGRWHAHAIRKAGGQVIAVVDRDIAAAERLATTSPRAGSFSSFDQMLDQTRPDVLHICTPLETHATLAAQAMRAGIHVLMEKPLTTYAAETEELYRISADRGVLLCPVHQFVFQNGVLKAQARLPEIGNLVHLRGVFCSAGGEGQPRERLDEIVADILPHPLSLLQLFLPEALTVEDWTTVRPENGELRAIRTGRGVTAEVFVSLRTRPPACYFELLGSQGTIYIDLFHGFSFAEPGAVSRVRKIIHPFDRAVRHLRSATVNLGRRILAGEPAYPGLQRLVSRFYRAINSGEPAPVSREESAAIARLREQLIRSSRACET